MYRHRHAKILATVGPSSNDLPTLEKLWKAGVDAFRLNFSHANHDQHAQVHHHIRHLEKKFDCVIAIVADLQGPKFRLGTFEKKSTHLTKGDVFYLDQSEIPGNEKRCFLPHPEVFDYVGIGTILLIDDGRVCLKVIEKEKNALKTVVCVNSIVSDHKGLNIPGIRLPISSLTPKDLHDLDFCLKLGVDWIALSFVQHPDDVLHARTYIKDQAKILTKLEKPMALEFLDDIVSLSDGVIVARGDLGIEVNLEEVPVLQKKIVRSCQQYAKPVIVATQMLESMISCPIPTRAEVSDVATAIYEGVDGVMLSAESASGAYPIEAVSMMDRIIKQVEKDTYHTKTVKHYPIPPFEMVSDSITVAAREITSTINVGVIATFTKSGMTAVRASSQRPKAIVMGLTPSIKTARFLNLVWGIYPIVFEKISSFNEAVDIACQQALTHKICKKEQFIIVTGSVDLYESGSTNILQISKAK